MCAGLYGHPVFDSDVHFLSKLLLDLAVLLATTTV